MTDRTDVWTYASANTVTVPTDLTATYYAGLKTSIVQTTTKYFQIESSTYSAGTGLTTITLNGYGTYTVANAAITAHSDFVAEAPPGFPLAYESSGRAGGQTLKGGTASGEDLTLMSTANVKKGDIIFGTSKYDEDNNRLGIGRTPATYPLEVQGDTYTTGSFRGDLIGNVTGTASNNITGPASAVDGNIVVFDGVTGKIAKDVLINASSFAASANGVTNGDSHDHSGGDGAQIDHGGLGGLSDDDHTGYAKLLGRAGGQSLIGGTASGDDLTLQSTSNGTKGDIVIGTSKYDEVNNRLGIGRTPTTYSLEVQGDIYATGNINGILNYWNQETRFTTTPASISTITMTADCRSTIKAGMGLKYVYGGITYYGIVTAISDTLLTIAGATLDTGVNITSLYWCPPERVIQVDFYVQGAFADATNTALLSSDMKTAFDWNMGKAYCVLIRHKVGTDDSGANQPRVTISIAGSVVGTDNTNVGKDVAETWTSTVVGINTSNYDINFDEAIEILTDDNGTNNDAQDLTVSTLFVFE